MRFNSFIPGALALASLSILASACVGQTRGGVYAESGGYAGDEPYYDDSYAGGEVYTDVAPPPPRETVVYHRPGYVWVTGRWGRVGGRWNWHRGYWVRQRPGYVWSQPRWVRSGNRWVYRAGGWNRGAVSRDNRLDRRDNRLDRRQDRLQDQRTRARQRVEDGQQRRQRDIKQDRRERRKEQRREERERDRRDDD